MLTSSLHILQLYYQESSLPAPQINPEESYPLDTPYQSHSNPLLFVDSPERLIDKDHHKD